MTGTSTRDASGEADPPLLRGGMLRAAWFGEAAPAPAFAVGVR
ncbi:hypothetical protein [Streptomyces sp. NPDC048357]